MENIQSRTAAGVEFTLLPESDGSYTVAHRDLVRAVEQRRLCVDYNTQMLTIPYEKGQMLECVVTCTIAEPGGYFRVSAVGESNAYTAVSHVEQMYPAITAANRAFDRAAIRYFGFREARVYSNLEKPFQTPALETVSGTPSWDENIILIGPLEGRRIKDVIDTKEFADYLDYLHTHPELVFQDASKNEQVKLLLSLQRGQGGGIK